jgi:hypothetical protein
MPILRKPSIADIYVNQMRTRFDRSFVPLFPPDVADIRVGTIGRFIEGRFDRRGHLADLLDSEDAFERTVAMAQPSQPASFSFHSAGSVHLEPSVTVSVAAQQLLKTRLSFTGDRAVVASFVGVVERTVASARDFDDLLWGMHLSGDLAPDEVVVWVHREAASGTVLVNRKGGVDVELIADPALVGGVISFEGLAAGIRFGEGSQVSSETTGHGLTVAVKAKGRADDDAIRIKDVRGFDASTHEQRLSQFRGIEIPSVAAEDVVADADFSAPED